MSPPREQRSTTRSALSAGKIVLFVALIAAATLTTWLAIRLTRFAAVDAHARPIERTVAPSTDDVNTQARLARIESTLQELESLVAELSRRVDGVENERRAVARGEPTASAPTGDSELDARDYLDRYVASFRGDENGDEFYRLAVQAHALELLDDIAALIGDGRQPQTLRVRLAEMLGSARFRGRARALDALFAALLSSNAPRLATTALGSLGNIGDLAVAARLTARVWSLLDVELRHEALELIVRLSEPDGNAAIQALFASAPSDDDLRFLIGLLTPSDPVRGLAVIRGASLLAHDVRLAAAHKVKSFHTPETVALIDAWLGYERDADVRAVLGAARIQAGAVPSWDAMRATGPPDADPNSHDDENAWACSRVDMGLQWLELTYQPAMRASLVRVVELNVGGAVAQVIGYDDKGGQHVLFPGGQGTQRQGVFEVAFAPTSFRVARLKVVLDTDKPGWNEVDAVELSGPDGSAWASHATASSNYGQ